MGFSELTPNSSNWKNKTWIEYFLSLFCTICNGYISCFISQNNKQELKIQRFTKDIVVLEMKYFSTKRYLLENLLCLGEPSPKSFLLNRKCVFSIEFLYIFSVYIDYIIKVHFVRGTFPTLGMNFLYSAKGKLFFKFQCVLSSKFN